MKLILSLCCRVIQRPQIMDKYPGAEKFLIFLLIWRSLPRRIGPKSHNRKMKNTIFFFLKLLFVSIANNFPLYHDITTVICFWSAQNTNTQCIQQCIFIKNTSYPTQTPHIKQPNGEIMQYGAFIATCPDSTFSAFGKALKRQRLPRCALGLWRWWASANT